ncbi:MAG TPA: hypothetical protein VGO91_16345 [Pyrinomonadaceae bacterium]|jgi:hypothetical protein|nr:hypothetical protein [Pyrinomonadaceae bacterium]
MFKRPAESHLAMFIRASFLTLLITACPALLVQNIHAQKRRAARAGERATAAAAAAVVVVDERLAVLRDAPDLSANLLQRLSRGRAVTFAGWKRAPDGLVFYRVMVTRRIGGWLQSEAVASNARAGDDERLLRLIRGSDNFDRVARARIFLDLYGRSPLRPAVLLLYGAAAEEAAENLSREARRRLDEREMLAGGAPLYSYFLNYNGLDRYRKQGIAFVFAREARRFHYDGQSWREILRRYPRSSEALEAGQRLKALAALDARQDQ